MTVFLYYDSLGHPGGGMGTYLHALATELHRRRISSRVVVTELAHSPIVDDLVQQGIRVYRQRRVPGDRWLLRKRLMMLWLGARLRRGDWVYCLCPPTFALYLPLARLVHFRGARLAVSWFVAPEFWQPTRELMGDQGENFCRAVAETDAVISVSRCTTHQFAEVYGYTGAVQVVPYHNLLFLAETLPLPPGSPWKIGFIGRLETQQKNLDTLLRAFALALKTLPNLELHLYGGGNDQPVLEALGRELGLMGRVFFHGSYDHRSDLPDILRACHFFVYPSRWEGGPCFSLLELLQAGRYCVAAPVGGIPDLYEGHPEAGSLADCRTPKPLAEGLLAALSRLAAGGIDPAAIRARYFDGFDMESAHRQWEEALGLVHHPRAAAVTGTQNDGYS